ncbi:hypothetical protein D3C85_1479740 [compost metagenome]
MGEPIGRRSLLFDFAFVDDRFVLHERLTAKIRTGQAIRFRCLGVEHFQERVGFVHHQRTARFQGFRHMAEEFADVRHPAQYADGDQRHIKTLMQFTGQVMNVGLDERGHMG